MGQVLQIETLAIELLMVATVVAIVVRRLRVPYTVALVIVGLLITLGQDLQIELAPELILALFVPPLLFEAAFHLRFDELRRGLPDILLLAIPGVVLTTLVVGALVAWATPLSLGAALVFGALIAATDPVAVVALFRAIGAPKRLAVLVEGESLFNDGTAIVIYGLVLTVALTGRFDPAAGLIEFATVAAGGTLIGLGLGAVVSWLIDRIDDYLIETSLTTVLAFGSYLVAERLHVSGVLAVVAAGLVCGNVGPRGMSPTTRIVLFNFWEYAAFLANSLVFLLIGLEVSIPGLAAAWPSVLAAIAAVLVARVAVVYSLGWLAGRLFEPVPLRLQHVLVWGGLRGAISLALALSLPVELGPERDLIRVMAFGVVLFTLLVQGTTVRLLVERLGLVRRDPRRAAYEATHAQLAAAGAAERHLETMQRRGSLSANARDVLGSELRERIAALRAQERELVATHPTLEAESLDTARREVLRAERSALVDLRRDGIVSDDVVEELAASIDAELRGLDEQADANMAEAVRGGPAH